MQTITHIPPKARRAKIEVSKNPADYELLNLQEAQKKMGMGKNLFRRLSMEKGCFPIMMGKLQMFRLSAIEKLIDDLDILKN